MILSLISVDKKWINELMGLFGKKRNAISQRCRKDESTVSRLKYDPWYKTFEKQDGAYVWHEGRKCVMFASNDYLGLSDHPDVIKASKKALEEWGCSPTGSRFANGSRGYHTQLEEELADFLGREACQVFSAGYLACMASVDSFAQRGDWILVDRNVHSSLWSGILLSGIEYERISHNNPSHLCELLDYEPVERPKLVVLEGVYSMEGHIAPIDEFIKVAKDKNCFFIVDDAHGLGVLGKNGSGTLNHLGVNGEVDLLCGSLSKSMSSTGGFIAGDKKIIEYLKTHSKQAIFSAAISPTQAAAANASLRIMRSDDSYRRRLWENTTYYKSLLRDIGVDFWESETPAVPIVLGDQKKVYLTWKALLKAGFFTIPVIPPGVPVGKDLIRTAISARHTREHIERLVETLSKLIH